MKNTTHTPLNDVIDNNVTLTNPKDIANAFNNYFAKVALNVQSSIKYSKVNFEKFLPHINVDSFFISPTDNKEVSDIIKSLNDNKAVGPNSIPNKILKLLNNDISHQLTDLFNLSFSSGVFPSILKTSKVTPIHKKDSKLKCSNYRPIYLL